MTTHVIWLAVIGVAWLGTGLSACGMLWGINPKDWLKNVLPGDFVLIGFITLAGPISVIAVVVFGLIFGRYSA